MGVIIIPMPIYSHGAALPASYEPYADAGMVIGAIIGCIPLLYCWLKKEPIGMMGLFQSAMMPIILVVAGRFAGLIIAQVILG